MIDSIEARPYIDIIAEDAKVNPDRIAAQVDDDDITISELDCRANQMARVYLSRDVGFDDIVTIAIPNSIELLVAILACWKVGARPNPISSKMPVPEIRSLVENGEPKLVLWNGEEDIGFPVIPADFVPGDEMSDMPVPRLSEPAGERALASGGSTGRPKLIVPNGRAVFQPEGVLSFFAIKHATVVPGPLYHAIPFSETWQGILRGATVVLMTRFDPEKFLSLIEKHKVDHLFIVPTMMLRVWQLPEKARLKYDLSSLETVISGGGPLPAWLMQAWIDWLGPDVMNEAFGPSERIGGTYITGTEWLEHPGSVGKPLPFAKMKVLDEGGNECSTGEMGILYFLPVAGAGSSYDYKGAESERIEDGWETVGDMGYLDDDGYLYLGDRRADMILVNGRNLFPAEIEGAIDQFPNVLASAVIGLSNENAEQYPHAIIECEPDAVDENELKSFLKNQLTSYKIPRAFEFVTENLRNEAGKMRRSALRAARLQDQSRS